MKTKLFFHILEYSNYGQIGSQGYYTTLKEAQEQCNRLADFFPKSNFEIFTSTSKKEPEIVTV
jgi:hypothetical protein